MWSWFRAPRWASLNFFVCNFSDVFAIQAFSVLFSDLFAIRSPFRPSAYFTLVGIPMCPLLEANCNIFRFANAVQSENLLNCSPFRPSADFTHEFLCAHLLEANSNIFRFADAVQSYKVQVQLGTTLFLHGEKFTHKDNSPLTSPN